MLVCDCLVELAHVFLDKTFTYLVKNDLKDKVKVGMRIDVPFGKQVLEGFVLKVYETDSFSDLKEILNILDPYPVLNDELILLGNFIKDNTMCSLMTAYQAMLPLALKAKKKVNLNKKYSKFLRINEKINLDDYKFNKTQQDIINILLKNKRVSKKVLDDISKNSVKTLTYKNILLVEDEEVYRLKQNITMKDTFSLTDKQKKVYDSVISSLGEAKTFLLHGVTGSGKTNIYMDIIKEVIKDNKTAIMLVPEISLTPQIIARFTSVFQDDIAVLHSGLSDGEKYDEWRKIKEKKVHIVIGARSAVFAPLEDIGVIIIDEEHSSTYKQESNPRYDAITIAKERSIYHKCPLILGSATPSLESYARALKNVYILLYLDERFNNKKPNIQIIDLNYEFKKANSYLTKPLISKIKEKIALKEQVILFLNRRGYSNTIICKNCGYTLKCPKCDISLTYHKSSNMLRCHYCGYASKREELCPSCHNDFKDIGIGTESVEEELHKLIPEARIVRMDIDTTTKKNAHEKIINDFDKGYFDILLGTQMIAKGLDFPNVTLVGIINADISLNFPDFRASETTFQLLEQVSGRSGRGEKSGDVLIQTFNQDHYAIRCAKESDYLGFFNSEMKIRKKLGYPPYYYIATIKVISKDYEMASSSVTKIAKYLKDNIKNEIILGPSVCNIFKLNNYYRFSIIIKYKDINHIKDSLYQVNSHYFNMKNVKVEIDFNPRKI